MPYKNSKERYLKGLCVCCPNKAEPNRTRCSVHAEKDRQNARRNMALLKKKRREEGKCIGCGYKLSEHDKGKVKCFDCIEQSTEYERQNGRRDRY